MQIPKPFKPLVSLGQKYYEEVLQVCKFVAELTTAEGVIDK